MNAETFCEHFATFADAPHGVEKLRELILQLAIQGKLVRLDEKDGLTELTAPKVELQSIATIVRGSSPRPKSDPRYFGGPVPRLLIADITRDGKYVTPRIDSLTEQGAALSRPMSRGSLVISISGSYGIPAFLAVDACIHDGFIGLRDVSKKLDLEYLFLVFRWHKPYFDSVVKDSGLKNLTTTHLKQMIVPMWSLANQRRIVEKVDQLLGLCDELAARHAAQREKRQRLVGATLDRLVSTRNPAQFPTHAHRLRNHFDQLFDTPTTIPQLRQTILQLAVQGQLMPQDPDDEPADRETSVEDYLTIQNGYAFKSEWFLPDGVRLVRNVNIGHDELRWDDLVCVSKDRAQEFARFELKEGDIVIALDRPLISTGLKVARLTKADLPALLLQRVGRPQFKDSRVLPEYFFLWLNSKAFTGSIDPGKSNGVPHIATKDVLRIRFAPPSPETQKRIVTKVTELLSLCDALEAKLTQAESASTQLLSATVHHLLERL